MMKTICLIWVMSGVPVASSIDLESWAMAVENKENRYARSNDRRIWVRLITLTCSSSLGSCNAFEPTSYVLRERPARNGDKTLGLRGSTQITRLKGHVPSEYLKELTRIERGSIHCISPGWSGEWHFWASV